MMGRVDGMDMEQLGNFLIDDEIRVTFQGSKVQYLYLFVKKLIFCDKVIFYLNLTSESLLTGRSTDRQNKIPVFYVHKSERL